MLALPAEPPASRRRHAPADRRCRPAWHAAQLDQPMLPADSTPDASVVDSPPERAAADSGRSPAGSRRSIHVAAKTPLAEQPSRPARPAGWLCVPRPERLFAELRRAFVESADRPPGPTAARQSLERAVPDRPGRPTRPTAPGRPAIVLAELRQIGGRRRIVGQDSGRSCGWRRSCCVPNTRLMRRVEIWDAASRLPSGRPARRAAEPGRRASLCRGARAGGRARPRSNRTAPPGASICCSIAWPIWPASSIAADPSSKPVRTPTCEWPSGAERRQAGSSCSVGWPAGVVARSAPLRRGRADRGPIANQPPPLGRRAGRSTDVARRFGAVRTERAIRPTARRLADDCRNLSLVVATRPCGVWAPGRRALPQREHSPGGGRHVS